MDDLLGKKFGFYGVDNDCFKLGRNVYEAIADDSDGYRSYYDSVQVINDDDGIFFKRPLGYVIIEDYDDGQFEGYAFRDVDNEHIWLLVGTDWCDTYYPCFTFTYRPKSA